MKHTAFCGLCRVQVRSWTKHLETKRHQKNVADKGLVLERYAERQLEIDKHDAKYRNETK